MWNRSEYGSTRRISEARFARSADQSGVEHRSIGMPPRSGEDRRAAPGKVEAEGDVLARAEPGARLQGRGAHDLAERRGRPVRLESRNGLGVGGRLDREAVAGERGREFDAVGPALDPRQL